MTRNDIRSKIASINDIKVKKITIKEWDNVEIEVRAMTGKQRSDLLNEAVGEDRTVDFAKIYPKVVIAGCYCPETGEQLFEKGDVGMLEGKCASAIEKIATTVLELSGLTDTDEIQKN